MQGSVVRMMQDHIQLKMIACLTVLNLLQADTLASVSCMLGCVVGIDAIRHQACHNLGKLEPVAHSLEQRSTNFFGKFVMYLINLLSVTNLPKNYEILSFAFHNTTMSYNF